MFQLSVQSAYFWLTPYNVYVFLQRFQEVISSWLSLKKVFVTFKSFHEVQILYGLMAKADIY